VLFTFSGFTLNCLMWPHLIACLALMPWVVLTMQRAWTEGGRQLAPAAVAGALQMLTGVPELILLTWLFIAAFWTTESIAARRMRWRTLFRLGLAALLVAAISAAQLCPTFELIQASDRDQQFADGRWAMPAWGWANFFIPLFRSLQTPFGAFFQSSQGWIASYYTGVCGLVFAIFAVVRVREARVWMLALLSGVSIALALGPNGPIYPIIRDFVPQLGFVRFQVKFLLLLNFTLPLLAALAINRFSRPYGDDVREGDSSNSLKILGAVAAAVILVIGSILLYEHGHTPRPSMWPPALRSGLTRAALLLGTAGILFALWRSRRSSLRILLSGTLLLIFFIDGRTHSPMPNPTVAPAALEPNLIALTPLPSMAGNRAFLSRPAFEAVHVTLLSDPTQDFLFHRRAFFCNCNLIEHVPTVDSFSPMYVRLQREVWAALWFRQTNCIQSPLLDFLAVAHVPLPGSKVAWTNRSTALPVATAGQGPRFADDAEALGAMASAEFAPQHTVFLPKSAIPVAGGASAADARIFGQKFSPQRIELQVSASTNTMLVLAQTFYGPWRASIDESPVPILRANHAFQSVVIPQGTHAVAFTYEDSSFRLGCIISLLGIGLAALAGWFDPRWL